MTDREKAIIMAYTGTCMLPCEKINIFHKYIEEICGRPIWTHELAIENIENVVDEIREKSKADFLWLYENSEQEQEPKWIPVSERFPENGRYLVALASLYGGEPRISIRSFAKDLNKVDKFDFPNKHKCGWYDYDSEYGYWEDTEVIAWMPLPKFYEPQESEEQA